MYPLLSHWNLHSCISNDSLPNFACLVALPNVHLGAPQTLLHNATKPLYQISTLGGLNVEDWIVYRETFSFLVQILYMFQSNRERHSHHCWEGTVVRGEGRYQLGSQVGHWRTYLTCIRLVNNRSRIDSPRYKIGNTRVRYPADNQVILDKYPIDKQAIRVKYQDLARHWVLTRIRKRRKGEDPLRADIRIRGIELYPDTLGSKQWYPFNNGSQFTRPRPFLLIRTPFYDGHLAF